MAQTLAATSAHVVNRKAEYLLREKGDLSADSCA
jgi:hypothetical protein